MTEVGGTPRFLTLADVAEILNTSTAQVYALVRRKELRAIKIGGRGQWRVETRELEAFIERMYAETQAYLEGQHTEELPDEYAEHLATSESTGGRPG